MLHIQLDEKNICVGYSYLNENQTNEKLIYLDGFWDHDFLWRKYENNTWSEEKFYPEKEEHVDELSILKEKVFKLEEFSQEQEAALIEIVEMIIGGNK